MRLRSLVIRELQGVAPTTLEFGNGIHVLLGKNGTGKTTLLRLLVAIVRTDFRAMLDQNFDISYSIESPGLEIEVAVRNQLSTQRANGNSRNTTQVHPPERGSRLQSKHELVIRVSLVGFQEAYELRYTPGKGILRGPTGEQKELRPFDLSLGGSLHGRIRELYSEVLDHDRIQLSEIADSLETHKGFKAAVTAIMRDRGIPDHEALEKYFQDMPGSALELLEFEEQACLTSVGRFDEALNVFAALTGGTREKRDDGVPDFVWAAIETHGKFEVYSYLPFVSAVLSIQIFLKLKGEKSPPDSLHLTANEFPPLKRFVDLTVYTDASMVLRREERVRRPGTDSYELRFRAPEFHFDLPHGDGDISHEQLSFGEKRLLAFLYYQYANEIVIADELVNGLHHSWIEACLDALAGRQAFLVSQNPLLLDHLPFNSPDDVRLHLIRCQRGRDGETKMHWRNFSEAEAHAFHRGYETGVQHVSEILIAEGLW